MASIGALKGEIRDLKTIFHKNHPAFQIVSATVDELKCRFIDPSGKNHTIYANITKTYPFAPPLWFSESDNVSVIHSLTLLSETSGIDNHLCNQVKLLLKQLCFLFSISLPSVCSDSSFLDEFPGNKIEAADHQESDDDDLEKWVQIEVKEAEDQDIKAEHLQVLKKLQAKRSMDDYLNGISSFSATERLMRELRDIYQSPFFKSGAYQVQCL